MLQATAVTHLVLVLLGHPVLPNHSKPIHIHQPKQGCLRGAKPLFLISLPLIIGRYSYHFMERGIQGVR